MDVEPNPYLEKAIQEGFLPGVLEGFKLIPVWVWFFAAVLIAINLFVKPRRRRR